MDFIFRPCRSTNMDKFHRWGIRKDISVESGYKDRVRFIVSSDSGGGTTRVLKTRRDVLLFLSKHTHIDLKPEDFVFKRETSEEGIRTADYGDPIDVDEDKSEEMEEDLCPIQSQLTHAIGTENAVDSTKTKRIKLDEADFESKINKVTSKSNTNPGDEYEEILKKLHEIRVKTSSISPHFLPSL